jgi:hypothetical protein
LFGFEAFMQKLQKKYENRKEKKKGRKKEEDKRFGPEQPIPAQ